MLCCCCVFYLFFGGLGAFLKIAVLSTMAYEELLSILIILSTIELYIFPARVGEAKK